MEQPASNSCSGEQNPPLEEQDQKRAGATAAAASPPASNRPYLRRRSDSVKDLFQYTGRKLSSPLSAGNRLLTSPRRKNSKVPPEPLKFTDSEQRYKTIGHTSSITAVSPSVTRAYRRFSETAGSMFSNKPLKSAPATSTRDEILHDFEELTKHKHSSTGSAPTADATPTLIEEQLPTPKTELEVSHPEFVDYWQKNIQEEDLQIIRNYIRLTSELEKNLRLLQEEHQKILGVPQSDTIDSWLSTLDSVYGDNLVFQCLNLLEYNDSEKILLLSINKDFEGIVRSLHTTVFHNVFKIINFRTLQNCKNRERAEKGIPPPQKENTHIFEKNASYPETEEVHFSTANFLCRKTKRHIPNYMLVTRRLGTFCSEVVDGMTRRAIQPAGFSRYDRGSVRGGLEVNSSESEPEDKGKSREVAESHPN